MEIPPTEILGRIFTGGSIDGDDDDVLVRCIGTTNF
jgi:hypothetical protein